MLVLTSSIDLVLGMLLGEQLIQGSWLQKQHGHNQKQRGALGVVYGLLANGACSPSSWLRLAVPWRFASVQFGWSGDMSAQPAMKLEWCNVFIYIYICTCQDIVTKPFPIEPFHDRSVRAVAKKLMKIFMCQIASSSFKGLFSCLPQS